MARRGYLDTSVGQVHYRTEGDGPPVLFVHQMGQSSLEYSRVLPIVGKRYRAVAIDTIGYGFSDPVPADFRIEDYARIAVECLDALGIACASVVAHHGGTLVATEIAVAHAERVDEVVLSGFPGPASLARVRETITSPEYKKGLAMDPEGNFLLGRWRLLRSWCAEGAAPAVWYPAFVSSLLPALLPSALNAGHVAALKYDIVGRLPLIARPTLFIKNGREYFVKDVDEMRALVSGSRSVTIEDGGHFVHLERPEEWAGAILAFLDGTSA